ncbi:hypothetical protein JL721_7809 [Aureococcus anophagefferens]|nr:hypothetical protein JL721_7809 [Aureococcus anophagefferens]
MALHHAGDSGTSIRLGDTICLALIGQRGFLTADGVSDNNLVFEKLHHGVNMPPNPRDVRFVVRRMANRRAQNELNRLHAKADYGYGGAVNGSGYDGRAELQRLAELEEQQNADDNRRLHRTPVGTGKVLCIVSDQGPNPGTLDIQLKDPSEASSDAHVRLFPALNSHDSHVDALTIRNGNLVVLEFVEQAMRLLITDGAAADKERPAGTLRTRGHPHVSRVDGVCATHTAGLRMEIMQLRAAEPETSLEKRLKLARRLNGSDVVKLAFTQTLEELALPAASWSTSSQLPTTTRPVFDRSIYKQQTFTNSMSWWVLEKTEMPSGAEEILAGVRHHYRIKHFVTGVYLGYVNRGQQRSAEDEGGIELTTWRSLREDKLGTTLFSLRLVAPGGPFGDGADRSPGGDAATAPLCDGDTVNIVSVVSGYALNCHVAVCVAVHGREPRLEAFKGAHAQQSAFAVHRCAEEEARKVVFARSCRNKLVLCVGFEDKNKRHTRAMSIKSSADALYASRKADKGKDQRSSVAYSMQMLLAEQDIPRLVLTALQMCRNHLDTGPGARGLSAACAKFLLKITAGNMVVKRLLAEQEALLFDFLGKEVDIEALLVEIYRDNQAALRDPKEGLIDRLFQAGSDAAGCLPEILELYSALTVCDGVPMKHNQDLIAATVFAKQDGAGFFPRVRAAPDEHVQATYRLFMKERAGGDGLSGPPPGEPPPPPLSRQKSKDAVGNWVDACSYMHITEHIVGSKSQEPEHRPRLRATRSLLADLCGHRNRNARKLLLRQPALRELVDYAALTGVVQSAMVPSFVRSAASRLWHALTWTLSPTRPSPCSARRGRGHFRVTVKRSDRFDEADVDALSTSVDEAPSLPKLFADVMHPLASLTGSAESLGTDPAGPADRATEAGKGRAFATAGKPGEGRSFGTNRNFGGAQKPAAHRRSLIAEETLHVPGRPQAAGRRRSTLSRVMLAAGGSRRAAARTRRSRATSPSAARSRAVAALSPGLRLGGEEKAPDSPTGRKPKFPTLGGGSSPDRGVDGKTRRGSRLGSLIAVKEAPSARPQTVQTILLVVMKVLNLNSCVASTPSRSKRVIVHDLNRVVTTLFHRQLNTQLNRFQAAFEARLVEDLRVRDEYAKKVDAIAKRRAESQAAVLRRGHSGGRSPSAIVRMQSKLSGEPSGGKRPTAVSAPPVEAPPPKPGAVTLLEAGRLDMTVAAAAKLAAELHRVPIFNDDLDPKMLTNLSLCLLKLQTCPDGDIRSEAMRILVRNVAARDETLATQLQHVAFISSVEDYRTLCHIQQAAKILWRLSTYVLDMEEDVRSVAVAKAVDVLRYITDLARAACDRDADRGPDHVPKELAILRGSNILPEVLSLVRLPAVRAAVDPDDEPRAGRRRPEAPPDPGRVTEEEIRAATPGGGESEVNEEETGDGDPGVSPEDLEEIEALRSAIHRESMKANLLSPERAPLVAGRPRCYDRNYMVLMERCMEFIELYCRGGPSFQEEVAPHARHVQEHLAVGPLEASVARALGSVFRSHPPILSSLAPSISETVVELTCVNGRRLPYVSLLRGMLYLDETAPELRKLQSSVLQVVIDNQPVLLDHLGEDWQDDMRAFVEKREYLFAVDSVVRYHAACIDLLGACANGATARTLHSLLSFEQCAATVIGAFSEEKQLEMLVEKHSEVYLECTSCSPEMFGSMISWIWPDAHLRLLRQTVSGNRNTGRGAAGKASGRDGASKAGRGGGVASFLDAASGGPPTKSLMEEFAEDVRRGKLVVDYVCDCVVPAVEACYGNKYLMRELMRGKLRPMDDRCRKKLAMALFDFVTEPHEEAAQQIALLLLSAQGQFCIPYSCQATRATVQGNVIDYALSGEGARFALQLRSLLVRVGQWVAAHRDLRKKRIVYEKQVTHAKAIELRQTMATEQRKKTGILFGDGHKHAKGPDAATNLHVALAVGKFKTGREKAKARAIKEAAAHVPSEVAKARNQSRAPGLEHHKKARLTSEAHVGNSLKKARMTSEANLAGPGGGPRRSMVKHAGLGGSLGRSSVIKERASMVSFAGGGVTSRQRTGSIAGAELAPELARVRGEDRGPREHLRRGSSTAIASALSRRGTMSALPGHGGFRGAPCRASEVQVRGGIARDALRFVLMLVSEAPRRVHDYVFTTETASYDEDSADCTETLCEILFWLTKGNPLNQLMVAQYGYMDIASTLLRNVTYSLHQVSRAQTPFADRTGSGGSSPRNQAVHNVREPVLRTVLEMLRERDIVGLSTIMKDSAALLRQLTHAIKLGLAMARANTAVAAEADVLEESYLALVVLKTLAQVAKLHASRHVRLRLKRVCGTWDFDAFCHQLRHELRSVRNDTLELEQHVGSVELAMADGSVTVTLFRRSPLAIALLAKATWRDATLGRLREIPRGVGVSENMKARAFFKKMNEIAVEALDEAESQYMMVAISLLRKALLAATLALNARALRVHAKNAPRATPRREAVEDRAAGKDHSSADLSQNSGAIDVYTKLAGDLGAPLEHLSAHRRLRRWLGRARAWFLRRLGVPLFGLAASVLGNFQSPVWYSVVLVPYVRNDRTISFVTRALRLSSANLLRILLFMGVCMFAASAFVFISFGRVQCDSVWQCFLVGITNAFLGVAPFVQPDEYTTLGDVPLYPLIASNQLYIWEHYMSALWIAINVMAFIFFVLLFQALITGIILNEFTAMYMDQQMLKIDMRECCATTTTRAYVSLAISPGWWQKGTRTFTAHETYALNCLLQGTPTMLPLSLLVDAVQRLEHNARRDDGHAPAADDDGRHNFGGGRESTYGAPDALAQASHHRDSTRGTRGKSTGDRPKGDGRDRGSSLGDRPPGGRESPTAGVDAAPARQPRRAVGVAGTRRPAV